MFLGICVCACERERKRYRQRGRESERVNQTEWESETRGVKVGERETYVRGGEKDRQTVIK